MNITSTCHYLFNREAKELFPNEDEEFVEESLKKIVEVIDNLIASRPEALFIFDPMGFNNQCHLYALFVAQGSNRKFLYLSVFLSYAFLADSKLFEKMICKELKAPSKEFRLFLKDVEGVRTRAARAALNVLFEQHLKETLCAETELANLAGENLQLKDGNESLYTFPKFAGVVFLIDAIRSEKIPLIFKVKVMTKEGNSTFSYASCDVQKLDPATPVIVFEMIATGEGLSYLECHEIAKKCFYHCRRNIRSKDRHKQNESCHFCSPKKVDVIPFKNRLLPIIERTDEMLLALGADFILQKQGTFLPFFSDEDKFPELTALFKKSVPDIEKFGLSRSEQLNLTVSHVYTDCAKYAASDALVIDAPYDKQLAARGLI